MSFLFGKQQTQAQNTPQMTGIRIQTSVYGVCIPILYGRNRVPGNLLWYGDFKAIAHRQDVGGKGGGSGSMTNYTYSASILFGLLEGPIASIESLWESKNFKDIADTGFGVLLGTYPQSPWGYLSTYHPSEAIGYQGIACAVAANYDLGSNAELPNLNFDCKGRYLNIPDLDDADPAEIIPDFLTNSHYGAGFPSNRLRPLTAYSNYCRAAGLLVAPLYSSATPANETLQELVELTNANFVWSEGKLGVVPFGDVTLSGNGATYIPDLTPKYDLTDDDFKPADGEDPVLVSRMRPADAYNKVSLEYLNRSNQYNPEPMPASDLVAIELYGLRPEDTKQAHIFCDSQAAQTAATLRVQSFWVRNQYRFNLSWKYILLDSGDIVTLTDSALGLNKKPVRITEISEDEEDVLAFTAIELIQGTKSVAAYPYQQASGYGAHQNIDPGDVHTPLIVEPLKKLVDSPQIWCAVAGGPNWGGCYVWVSTDGGSSYEKIGTIIGASRYGVLTAALPDHVDPDTDSTLSVDLTTSKGALVSGSTSDANLFVTLCYVDGEYISFRDALLTSQYNYDLSYLRRGANASAIGAHAAGSDFARLDGGIFKYKYTQNLIDQQLYIKFTSFNLNGN